MREGKVIWFNIDKGYGIIESNDERFLIHESDLLNDKKIKRLSKERKVKFIEDANTEISTSNHGLKRAKDVEII